jgi:hypothetical protein
LGASGLDRPLRGLEIGRAARLPALRAGLFSIARFAGSRTAQTRSEGRGSLGLGAWDLELGTWSLGLGAWERVLSIARFAGLKSGGPRASQRFALGYSRSPASRAREPRKLPGSDSSPTPRPLLAPNSSPLTPLSSPSLRALAPRSSLLTLAPKIQAPSSKLQAPSSKIRAPSSKIQDPRSSLLDPRSSTPPASPRISRAASAVEPHA